MSGPAVERCKCGHLVHDGECWDVHLCRGHWCWCHKPSPAPVVAEVRRASLNLDGTDPIAESAYCHHRHHLDEHSTDFDTCPHWICAHARNHVAEVARLTAERDEKQRQVEAFIRRLDFEIELVDKLRAEQSALRTRLRGLEQQWRTNAVPQFGAGLEQAADELARLLTTPEEPEKP